MATLPYSGKKFNTLDMNFRIVHTCTMPHVNGKLKHCETIFLKLFAEKLVSAFVFLGFGRQIKKHQYPHYSIFANSVHN